MSEVQRINEQLQRAFSGGAWHGPSVQEILQNVSAQQAAIHPIPGAHSIWELVLHIAAWENAGRRRLAGDRAQLSDDENWPPVTDTSDEAWERTKQSLLEGHARLQQAIERIEETRLDQPILDGLASVYVTMHGVIQHDLYHAGQMAILKKALEQQS